MLDVTECRCRPEGLDVEWVVADGLPEAVHRS